MSAPNAQDNIICMKSNAQIPVLIKHIKIPQITNAIIAMLPVSHAETVLK